jgi:cytidylate kinase
MSENVNQPSKRKYVITIGRQFGSGGREFAKLIAETFGIAYYDKELLLEAARHSGMNPEFLERADEKVPSFTGGGVSFNMGLNLLPWYTPTPVCEESIYSDMSAVIKEIADRGPCVIVGRSADYILRDYDVPSINVFVHAPLDVRVKRILARGDKMNEHDARNLATKADKLRANFYNFYTDKRWGDAASYDICLDSSLLSMEGMVAVLASYVHNRLGFSPIGQ